jgi:hypothetical protein
MTVYVIQEANGRNILPAREFGELEVLLPSNANIVLSPGPTVRRLNKALGKFSQEDYLLLMGDPAAIGIACAVAAKANNGVFNLLKWDRFTSQYFPINVDLNNTREGYELSDAPEAIQPSIPVRVKRKKGESNNVDY